MKSFSRHALCVILLLGATLLPLHAVGKISTEKPTSEAVAGSWDWAKDDEAIKNPKNVGKARKLRKKSAAAAANEKAQLQAWALLGDGLCALAGAEICTKNADVFESSLKDYSNRTLDVLKKGER